MALSLLDELSMKKRHSLGLQSIPTNMRMYWISNAVTRQEQYHDNRAGDGIWG